MKVLFIHQNFPGQFLHLAPELARRGHECLALTDLKNNRASAIPVLRYKHEPVNVDPAATRLGRNYTVMSDRGVSVARAARQLRDERGYTPDVIFGHSGWGGSCVFADPQRRLAGAVRERLQDLARAVHGKPQGERAALLRGRVDGVGQFVGVGTGDGDALGAREYELFDGLSLFLGVFFVGRAPIDFDVEIEFGAEGFGIFMHVGKEGAEIGEV